MTTPTTLGALADHLLDRHSHRRVCLAVVGPPGSGKSTFTDRLRDRLNTAHPGIADIVAMDGFHFDDRVLEARGHRARKGAPHTFDVEGLAATLDRLLADDSRPVVVPVFDRAIEIARAGAHVVPATARIILVEGNYLLLDDPAWSGVRDRFDITVKLDVPHAVLVERLTRRWSELGLSASELATKMQGNDLPNVALVEGRSHAADFSIANT